MRTNIGFSVVDKPLRSLLVTSAVPRDGKSVTAANLAIFMAKAGKNTLLIDADLRRPTQHEKFNLPGDKIGLSNAILAIAVVSSASFARLVRGSVLSLREREFVYAARLAGAHGAWIVWRHVLPNALSPVIVFATLEAARTIIFAAGLSFLGLGAQPPTAEWGAMLAQGRGVLNIAPHVASLPGVAILLVSLGLNLFGDGLRDAFDPRLR